MPIQRSKKRRVAQRNCNLHFEKFTLELRWHSASYFSFRIVARDGSRIASGDQWDLLARLDNAGGGSPLERLQRALRRVLGDPNRSMQAA
jgi:hypothetical protein